MKTIGLICGGQSTEHEVSLVSAKNIIENIDKTKYKIELIGISKEGEWYYCRNHSWLPSKPGDYKESVEKNGEKIAITPGNKKPNIISLKQNKNILIDIFLPITHGTNGEDGTLQGLLHLLNTPYIGPNTLGSAIGMDKEVMKRLLIFKNIKTAKYKTYKEKKEAIKETDKIIKELGLPLFIKPASLGSSVGISKANNKEKLINAIKTAFKYDKKILIEEAIDGRELECAILGNNSPKASTVGEVSGYSDFYSYKAKYIDENGAKLTIPAELDKRQEDAIQRIAIETFKTLECEGLARVDVFLTKKGEIYVNEINTLPGFTKISMYPSLWNQSGIDYTELLTNLINLATERFNAENNLKKIN